MREEFTFQSVDGKTALYAVKRIPEGEPKAVIQITHGMLEYIGRYKAFADYLEQNGFVVAGHDQLGHGHSAAKEEDFGYFREENPSGALVEDMHELRAILQHEYPDLPYFMLGHSMGSYLLRQYLAQHGAGLSGAILTGTGYADQKTTKAGLMLIAVLKKVHGSHYRSTLIQKMTYGESYKHFDMSGTDATNSWLTKDPEIVRKYYHDPFCTYLFTLNGYEGLLDSVQYTCNMDNVNRIPKDLPILIASGEDDPVGDLGVGVRKVERMFQMALIWDLTVKLYKDDRHEILNETDKEKVWADILAWVTERL